ncbi:hypothetical protein EYC84_009750 [Monilinia fructicola]|uniref:ABC transporter domain-containing protein n=1 Tax=Monilinia fructicola TaxID=38448 RepID=A0A5M9J9N9_MONFR|nr:hypothetical protein EYC84_009750 [Monilinia fructicola]
MDNSGYQRLREPPITPPSRVHTAYPREKHQKIECAPKPGDPFQDSSLPRPSFAEQRFELPSTLLSPLKAPESSDRFKNPFLNLLPNSPLNPRSDNFSPEEWISNLVAFMGQDPRRYPRRSAGFSVENLSVHAFRKPTDYQKNVGNIVFEMGAFARWVVGSGKQKVQILKGFDCLVEHGEMLLLLGRPGSGVSTLLKTISGDTNGLFIDPDSTVNYQGVSMTEMHTSFRGEAIFVADSDVHFPNLTVGETLLFAAKARAPPDFTFPGVTRQVYAEHMRDVIMATLGLSHVEKMPVGNDYVKGISAGERKRVSIGEVVLSGCTLQCWDHSTRGLDTASALDFCFEFRVPRTPEEFVMVWKTSRYYARLMLELEAYENEYPFDGSHALDFAAARRSQQAKYLFASLSSSDYDLTNQFTEERQTSTFQWKNICLDIKTVDGTCRILDHVDGWAKPGTLTALMGPSGAGKTSLLDVLASRSNVGIVSGEMFVDGCMTDISFQRKVGYVQQQDFHLSTMTVREALQFSATMRQSSKVTKKEKFAYVEEIIKLLEMDVYADAVVGAPREGLNIEQRKKLTIGVELVAKPKLLLFLDEPTSDLDSSTAWDIIGLLKRITTHGQAVLCSIHQPSMALFQRFDSLLFLGPGGRPIYFGRLGVNCETVKKYFEANGADRCPSDGNVVEWIMQTIDCTSGSQNAIDWPEVWKNSHELVLVHRKLDHMRKALCARSSFFLTGTKKSPRRKEFATPFFLQVWHCFRRTSLHYWRMPSYIYSKIALCLFYALFIGSSFFKNMNSLQDLRNQILGVFMLLALASSFVPQLLPNFLVQRALFEAREYPAKIYSWPAFIISNVLVELPWNTLVAIIVFLSWYYPTGMYENALLTKTMLERNGVMLLFIWVYLIYASTFGFMVQIDLEFTELAGNLLNVAFLLSLMFCSIIPAPTALPQIWDIVWRLSPFTYLVDGILSVGLANDPVTCSQYEFLHFEPVTGSSCGSYMASYIHQAGGYLTNPSAKSRCLYCPLKDANEFLAGAGMSYNNRWRNFCVMWAYVGFNVIMTLFLYWLVRIPKGWVGKPRVVLGGASGLRDGNGSEVGGGDGSHSERSFVKVRGYKEDSPQSRKYGRSDEIELVEM